MPSEREIGLRAHSAALLLAGKNPHLIEPPPRGTLVLHSVTDLLGLPVDLVTALVTTDPTQYNQMVLSIRTVTTATQVDYRTIAVLQDQVRALAKVTGFDFRNWAQVIEVFAADRYWVTLAVAAAATPEDLSAWATTRPSPETLATLAGLRGLAIPAVPEGRRHRRVRPVRIGLHRLRYNEHPWG